MAHGGKRKGAGRPQVKLSRTLKPLKKATAEEILAEHDEIGMWRDLLTASEITSVTVIGGAEGLKYHEVNVPDYKIRIDALKYLTNRRDGMPAQSVKVEDNTKDLNFGSIPIPDEFNQPRTVDKPN